MASAPDPLEVDIPPAARRVLDLMAEAGIVGATAAEVAAYLIVRGLDDLMRDGVLKLGSEPSAATAER